MTSPEQYPTNATELLSQALIFFRLYFRKSVGSIHNYTGVKIAHIKYFVN